MHTRIIRLRRALPPTATAQRHDIRYKGRHATLWEWTAENGTVHVRFMGRTYTRDPDSPKRDRATYFQAGCKIRGRSVRRYLHRDIYSYFKGPIPRGFVVHHINHNPLDSHPRNLQVLTRADHVRLHNRARRRSAASRRRTGRSVTLGYLRRQLGRLSAHHLLALILRQEGVVEALVRIGSRKLTKAVRRIVRYDSSAHAHTSDRRC